MPFQTTLQRPVSCTGIGLHSGENVRMVIRPADVDAGIVFRRKDLSGKAAVIPARYDLVTTTRLGTTLTNAYGTSISTVEHVMAALWGAGIDNATVDVWGIEIPIMDGSSAPFSALLQEAGMRRLGAPRKILRILKEVEVRQGASMARVAPYEGEDYGCSLELEIDFGDSVVARGRAFYDFADISFEEALSAARTFGFAHEVEALRAAGLARGGSLENAIVVGEQGILNKEGLRFSDEFIRHKALDCVGDLYLAGIRIEGAFSFIRPGHGVNNALLRALFNEPDAWRLESTLSAPVHAEVAAYAL